MGRTIATLIVVAGLAAVPAAQGRGLRDLVIVGKQTISALPILDPPTRSLRFVQVSRVSRHGYKRPVRGWQVFDAGPIIRANWTLCTKASVRIRFRWYMVSPGGYQSTYTAAASQYRGCHRHRFRIWQFGDWGQSSFDEGWWTTYAEFVLNGRTSVWTPRSISFYID